MNIEKLWAPWRMEYIRSKKDKSCIFCDKPKNNNDRKMLILHKSEHAFVMMNLYPYNNGHLLIAPYAHVDNTQDMTNEEKNEVMTLADQSMTVIKKTMQAEGFNFGANIGSIGGAGIEEHIHFHIVPRWKGDTNFMPIIGHTKVQVDGLLETYDRLKRGFEKR